MSCSRGDFIRRYWPELSASRPDDRPEPTPGYAWDVVNEVALPGAY